MDGTKPIGLMALRRQLLSDTNFDELSSFSKAAVQKDKQERLRLAVYLRWFSLALLALLVLYMSSGYETVYYLGILAGFALIGWAQLNVGRAGRSRPELFLMIADLILMVFAVAIPNPFQSEVWSTALQFRYNGFSFFFILLAAAVLSYSWRTVLTMGLLTVALWIGAVVWAWSQLPVMPALSGQIEVLLAGFPDLLLFLDPDSVIVPIRIQELVVFLIVVVLLAVGNWRSSRLLINLASAERERGNLARYFSPNVVDELAQQDDPLKQMRTQDVGVLFVDIIGFTNYAEKRNPTVVITTLREFHTIMETQVFAHEGTLDKYLGDGLMATFGTPVPTPGDATNALRCACAMVTAIREWNQLREASGDEPIEIGIGLHYGRAVLGDIGTSRLEFAVIGNTVNVASRLEKLTRDHATPIMVSDALVCRLPEDQRNKETQGFTKLAPVSIRGVDAPLAVWKHVATAI